MSNTDNCNNLPHPTDLNRQEYARTGEAWTDAERQNLFCKFRTLGRIVGRSPLAMLYQLQAQFGPALQDPEPKALVEGVYMCFVAGGKAPHRRHSELSAAMEEAMRLCQQQNTRALVLQLVGDYFPVAAPKWTDAKDSED